MSRVWVLGFDFSILVHEGFMGREVLWVWAFCVGCRMSGGEFGYRIHWAWGGWLKYQSRDPLSEPKSSPRAPRFP